MTDEEYFEEAAKEARKSTCKRAHCGSIVILNEEVIGRGYNSPPLNDENNRTCDYEYLEEQRKPKADRSCCMHAEWRAILDALKNMRDLKGAALYFVRVDEKGNAKRSNRPYCTVCSRLALDVGIKKFYLWRDEGPKGYDTEEYNQLSYDFHNPEKV
jgi:deoxycytidylate deaminase